MSLKIALLGSAPSSVAIAPYDDPSWKIWGCSPGCFPYARRWDVWFEIHRWQKAPWFSNEYIQFMASKPENPVYMIRPVPEIPNSVAYPKEEMVAKFGPWFMNSTISWMFALAIHQGATEIGLWGIDMSAAEEWIYQRAGCQFFIHMAKMSGIKVHLPPESDLNRPAPLYGYSEEDPQFIKLHARKAELQIRISELIKQEGQSREQRLHLQGALDNIEYDLKTWVADPQALAMAYSQPDWSVEPVKTQGILPSNGTDAAAKISSSLDELKAAIETSNAIADAKSKSKTVEVK